MAKGYMRKNRSESMKGNTNAKVNEYGICSYCGKSSNGTKPETIQAFKEKHEGGLHDGEFEAKVSSRKSAFKALGVKKRN